MKHTELDEAIYQKYIAPTQRKRKRYVGIELEYPIVNLNHTPVDFQIVHQLSERFVNHFRFDERRLDDEGHIYSATSAETGDCLSFECSYNTLELSLGKEESMNVLYRRFAEYYTFIQEFLGHFGHRLTGMGINPNYRINNNVPIPNGRYRMLLHHLSSYRKYGDAIPFHTHPEFGLFASASQVQLDVEEQDIVETLHTFARLEPFKAILFANSPFGEQDEWLLSRDQFWRNSLHGLNRRNVDFYDERIGSIAELIAYMKQMSIFCAERGDKYINFPPTPLEQYFSAETVRGEYYADGAYHEIEFHPELHDLAWVRSYKLEDLTYRGTVEYRSVCEQPVSQVLAPAAFHAGLAENLHELTALLQRDTSLYGHGLDTFALRDLLNHRDFPDFLDRRQVSRSLLELLDLARDGLERRALHEAHFLDPLYERAERLLSPAREMTDGLCAGVPVDYYIEQFSILKQPENFQKNSENLLTSAF